MQVVNTWRHTAGFRPVMECLADQSNHWRGAGHEGWDPGIVGVNPGESASAAVDGTGGEKTGYSNVFTFNDGHRGV
jgi:hypothetical protein